MVDGEAWLSAERRPSYATYETMVTCHCSLAQLAKPTLAYRHLHMRWMPRAGRLNGV